MTCGQARKLLDNPRVRQWVDGPDVPEPCESSSHRLNELRRHLAACRTCARCLATDHAIAAVLGHRTAPVRESDLAPAVLKAIRDRRADRSSKSLRVRWEVLPMEWRAVPIAATLCAGLALGWLAAKDDRSAGHWLAGLDDEPAGRSLVSALVPDEPWGGENQ